MTAFSRSDLNIVDQSLMCALGQTSAERLDSIKNHLAERLIKG